PTTTATVLTARVPNQCRLPGHQRPRKVGLELIEPKPETLVGDYFSFPAPHRVGAGSAPVWQQRPASLPPKIQG
ncbi:MAG: hypothetical protein COT91_02385, partial [Candidatus Doudnabacteria bacterium CG10_big_fil_rev_8_21_14_0_10_41_10]